MLRYQSLQKTDKMSSVKQNASDDAKKSSVVKSVIRLTTAIQRYAVYTASAFTLIALIFIVGYILYKGIPNITPELFSLKYTSDNCSVVPAIINTFSMTLTSLLIAVPIGVFAAVYLTEYAGRGNRLVSLVRMTAETLSGIPSIVYGLFGYIFFVVFLGWEYSMAAGACMLAIMILPLVLRTSEEALKAVPDTYREGSFGLGAGKLRTIFRIVLPSAVPGILSGVVLSIGRIVGETAALIYTAGTVAQVAGLADSGRTLSMHMYALWNEGLSQDKAYGAAVVLLAVVLIINALSANIAKRLGKR